MLVPTTYTFFNKKKIIIKSPLISVTNNPKEQITWLKKMVVFYDYILSSQWQRVGLMIYTEYRSTDRGGI